MVPRGVRSNMIKWLATLFPATVCIIAVVGCNDERDNSVPSAQETVQLTGPPVVSFRDPETGKYGFLDRFGNVVIEPQYRVAGSIFTEGLAAVKNESLQLGFINQSGKLVIPYKFESSTVFNGGTATIKMNGKWGVINRKGELLTECKYDTIPQLGYSDARKLVSVNGKSGYLDPLGREVIPLKYDSATPFRDGIARVEIEGKRMAIDVQGNPLRVVTGTPSGGLFMESRKGQKEGQGFVDWAGRVVIPLRFQKVRRFSEGLAPVMVEEKWGYIDKAGRYVIEPAYDEAGAFHDGLALVRTGELWALIDAEGRELFTIRSAQAFRTDHTLIKFWGGDHGSGIVNTAGKVIWGDQSAITIRGKLGGRRVAGARMTPK